MNNAKPGERITQDTVRDNYREHKAWTYAEAGKEAGLASRTVLNWGRDGRFAIANKMGPLNVDAGSFLRYVQTGTPQR